ncbi:MAG TPA: RND transporter, partial [Gammaproteobacteria bacterium]|nr:RND transporter [Gammaproteobacteria bacterium]
MNKMVRYVLIGFYAIVLTGCTVGPDFQRPAPPDVPGYTPTPVTTSLASAPTTLGEPQRILKGKRLTKYWWQALGNQELNRLINEALKHNFTLAAAEATLRQARELYAAQAGSTLYPQLDGNLGAQAQRFNPQTLGQAGETREFSLYNAGV